MHESPASCRTSEAPPEPVPPKHNSARCPRTLPRLTAAHMSHRESLEVFEGDNMMAFCLEELKDLFKRLCIHILLIISLREENLSRGVIYGCG